MPKPPPERSDPGGSRLERKHRHSLQPNPVTEAPPSALRHTQSHRYDSKGKKRKSTYVSQISSIMESENSDDELDKGVVLRMDKTKSSVAYENEKRGSRAAKSQPKESAGSNKSAFVFDNAAFEGSIGKRSSAANSSRAPSVQSLEIVREQYCCCAKRTKCERTLLVVIIVLVIIIVVLVVVLIFVAQKDNLKDFRMQFNL